MAYQHPRCEILPLPGDQVAFQVDGQDRLRWHFGSGAPRPFFFPLVGPSGRSLTRMGHPGAANHDHHRSIWFAHAKVLGIDFWSDQTEARIRQKHWLCYRDGNEEVAMAVSLAWYDGHDPTELLEQELVAAVRPLDNGETLVELQATFRPRSDLLEFGMTNFGFLAVRVAKSLSAHFGGGQLTSGAGEKGEADIFGKPSPWMDYSGPVPRFEGEQQTHVVEGITYFDHPSNPRYPSRWHVREDGWMGASVCMREPLATTREAPLRLRYLLHAHRGAVQPDRAKSLAEEFAARPHYIVAPGEAPHEQFRLSTTESR
jgi:hypothetical protein